MNMNFGLGFHHFGLALQNDTEAITLLHGLGYKIGDKVFDPEQNVHLRYCSDAKKPAVELILPGNGEGPLTPILKRYNEIIYHICYETDKPARSLKAMQVAGLRVINLSPPKPALLFDGRKVSFYKVMGFGLIELLWPPD